MWRSARIPALQPLVQCRAASKAAAKKIKKTKTTKKATIPQDWLLSRKSDQLRQLAIACGTPCSGTKQLLARGLEDALVEFSNDDEAGRPLSIISIDMGIRNLAYCHLMSKLPSSEAGQARFADVRIDAWRRVDMSTEQEESTAEIEKSVGKPLRKPAPRGVGSKNSPATHGEAPTKEDVPTKEVFSPAVYADRAYSFVTDMLQRHKPTHVLIERQRFRSGGGPAVQEWSLRVGMFEFMLYATLKTLSAQNYHDAAVVPMQPRMVNKFWLSQDDLTEQSPTSAAMKKYKIDEVSHLLGGTSTTPQKVAFSKQAKDMKDDFLEKFNRTKGKSKPSALPKLDDVSDCLLQGLAWLAWQDNRSRLRALKISTMKGITVDVASAQDDPWVHLFQL